MPWESLYDPQRGDYLCLDPYTPLVRYLDLPQRIQLLSVTPPLRILGMVAAPSDLAWPNVATEQANLERALAALTESGLVELTWLAGAIQIHHWLRLTDPFQEGPLQNFSVNSALG